MKYITFSVLLFYTITAKAQTFFKTYDWEKTPVYHNLPDSKDEVVLKRHIVLDYVYEDDELVEYNTVHRIIHVFTKDNVEANNKLYIPMGRVIEVTSVRARKIDKNGKVVVANPNNLKESDNVEGYGAYKMLPIEGLQEGDEVEVLYTVKKKPSLNGIQYMQDENMGKDITFEIFTPSTLKFEAKSYNGLSIPKEDTLPGRNHIYIHEDVIEGVKDDKYMNYKAHIKKCAYQFCYNYAKNQSRLFTYDIAAERYYKGLAVPEKSEVSAVKSLIKKMDVKNLKGEELVRQVEIYCKKNINIDKSLTANDGLVDNIMKVKAATPEMFFRMFCLVFDQLEVPFQIVVTSDRTDDPFDPDFNCWAYLDNELLYFPELNLYMAPSNFSSRLGFIPPEYAGQKGLFIKSVEVNGFKSGIGKIKDIPPVDVSKSHHAIYATMDLTKPGNENHAFIKTELTGYPAYYSQAIYEYISDDKKSQLTDPYLRVTEEQGKVSDVKVENGSATDALVKPFIMTGTLTDETLTDHAGDKLLVKVGLLIGKQVEMYESKNRNFPADVLYAHSLIRRIEIKLPDNYIVANPDAAKIHEVCMGDDGKPLAEFTSTYTMSGNSYIIECTEVYNALTYPADKFDAYRKVINAAADFNKITLVLNKK